MVMKFGGATLATPLLMRGVAERIFAAKEEGKDVVVVLSAPGDMTDELIEKAKAITPNPDEREMDMLLATGEQQSIALMAIALKALGCDAISFTGPQVGIVTDDAHSKARIVKMGGEKIHKALHLGKVAIVAGFQGETEEEEITTLGRGGSDLTAVALAAALKSEVCEFYKDVDGVYTANPRVVPDARKLELISYDEMLEMASLGAQVLYHRSVEFAKKNNIVLHVRSSTKPDAGTLITKEVQPMEGYLVTGITHAKDEAKLTILWVPDQPGIAAKIFCALAEADINIDVIVQDISEEGTTNISFTVNKSDLVRAKTILDRLASELGAKGVLADENIGKVSVVGVGMMSHSGVAAKMFSALAERGINIQMISTSEIKISVIVAEDLVEDAVRAIHERFNLSELD
ncbi:aspartate kinase [candidate division FCPU426 bacterium]|nr:aspartate kinase [candidate division FCPU426 bacterium]